MDPAGSVSEAHLERIDARRDLAHDRELEVKIDQVVPVKEEVAWRKRSTKTQSQ